MTVYTGLLEPPLRGTKFDTVISGGVDMIPVRDRKSLFTAYRHNSR